MPGVCGKKLTTEGTENTEIFKKLAKPDYSAAFVLSVVNIK